MRCTPQSSSALFLRNAIIGAMKHRSSLSMLEIGSPLALPEHIHDYPELSQCDIIGDVHGCYDELVELLVTLGHENLTEPNRLPVHDGLPRVLFVGDLVDRGDQSIDVLRLVMRLCTKGYARMVLGNHDHRFLRWLQGRDVAIEHGLDTTIYQLRALPARQQEAFGDVVTAFLSTVPLALRFDQGKAVVVHAAWRPRMKEETELKRLRYYAMYGPVTGERTPQGFPVRIDWASTYKGPEFAVFGHQVYLKPYRRKFTCGIDTGCVFGGALTALRYPSMEIVSIKSHGARATYNGPILDPDEL